MIVPFVAAIGIPLVDFRTYAVAFASGINHVHPLCFSAITGPQHIHVVPFVPGMEENLPSRYATPGWLLRYCHESGGSKGGKACPLMLVPVLVCCRHRWVVVPGVFTWYSSYLNSVGTRTLCMWILRREKRCEQQPPPWLLFAVAMLMVPSPSATHSNQGAV